MTQWPHHDDLRVTSFSDKVVQNAQVTDGSEGRDRVSTQPHEHHQNRHQIWKNRINACANVKRSVSCHSFAWSIATLKLSCLVHMRKVGPRAVAKIQRVREIFLWMGPLPHTQCVYHGGHYWAPPGIFLSVVLWWNLHTSTKHLLKRCLLWRDFTAKP